MTQLLHLTQKTKMPSGNMLMIHPAYVHYSDEFQIDPYPFLPVGLLYAGELLEQRGVDVTYHDSQLHDLAGSADIGNYDNYGITVMGAQNIASAVIAYGQLTNVGVNSSDIYFGGQGVEKLTQEEFHRIFPGSNLLRRQDLMKNPDYWNTSIKRQLHKFSRADQKTYLENELTTLLSQGCHFACDFCGAQTGMKETFYNTTENLRTYFTKATELGITEIKSYVTSLDFFQQALKGGNSDLLKKHLRDIVALKSEYGIELRLRALTRADSYVGASRDEELMSLVKDAGFYQFGFGADGAANVSLLRAMHKGTEDLASSLLNAFSHAEKNGFAPEILYVFGIPEDTIETLEQTKDLCIGLLHEFPSSIYRGFPAKNSIPGNRNWMNTSWKNTTEYQKLLSHQELFTNLGFESLANFISHSDLEFRRAVNHYAVTMSYAAHQFGRVQSFLTVPIMETDGNELMNQGTFEKFSEIVRNYAPDIAKNLTLENLPEHRIELNRRIPKDK